MSDLFAKARAASPVAPKKAKSKPETQKFEMPGVIDHAGTCAAEKAIKALKGSLELPLKTAGYAKFIEIGMSKGARPDNFKFVEGKLDTGVPIAETGVELRRKGENVPLTDEECELLDAHDIPYKTSDTVVETFIFKPEYMEDPVIMKKVSDALSKVKGLPDDLIQHQSAKARIVTDDSITACFQVKVPALCKALLGICTTVSLKPKMNGSEESALQVVEKLVASRRGAKEAEAC